jgi:hypothetical protein
MKRPNFKFAIEAAKANLRYSERFFVVSQNGELVSMYRPLDLAMDAAKSKQAYLINENGTVFYDPTDRV